MADELFRSDDLLVRRVGGHGDACCVVTFDSFTDFRTLDRPGFGEGFFDASGIDAIHVIPRENTWYQEPEMLDAMARVHEATRHYGRVVTYGSSMGGYGAIRFAGVAGAQVALALSPQYSIAPKIAPWEDRWIASSRFFRPVWEGTLPFPALDEAYVVYDPCDLDRKHIALLRTHFQFQAIELPRGGHPVTGFLAEIGLLQGLILAICKGRFDRTALLRDARERQTGSAQYMIAVAEGTSRLNRAKRLALMQEAVRLAPNSAFAVCRLAIEFRDTSRFAEALALHRRTLEIAPGQPNLLLHYSLTLERSGALDEALAVQQALCDASGGPAIYRLRLEKLRRRVARRRAGFLGATRLGRLISR